MKLANISFRNVMNGIYIISNIRIIKNRNLKVKTS